MSSRMSRLADRVAALILIAMLFVLASGSSLPRRKDPFIAVLAYHHIIAEPMAKWENNPWAITLDQFKAEMKYLKDNGYYTASLKDVSDFIYKRKNLPEKTVLVTFDDSYESSYVYAYPILKAYKFKAAVFVIGGMTPEENPPFDPEGLSWNSWQEINEMSASGVMEFGSHTYEAHYFIGDQPALLSLEASVIENDFKTENELFARHGNSSPVAVGYPYGAFNGKVIAAAKKQGYRLGVTVRQGYVYRNSPPLNLSRISITPGQSITEFAGKLAGGNSRGAGNGTMLK